jgi:ABC-type uncharacterized transport system ATPase subunit
MMSKEEVVETEAKETEEEVEEVTALMVAEHYASQVETLPENIKMLIQPTAIRDGKEAFLVFGYDEKRFKVTFEEVQRVRMPKGVKKSVAEEA